MTERQRREDEDSNIIYSKRLRSERPPIDFNVSSELNRKLLDGETWKIQRKDFKKPSVQLASANIDILDTVNIIDTYDRPKNTKKEGRYAGSRRYVDGFEDKPGKRLPKFGAQAEAGVGRARAELSVLEAEAKGPNAMAGVEGSVLGIGAMARAEIGSTSAKAGPLGVKLGLGVDTGASFGVRGLEAKFLGTGISVGPKTSVSLLGSEVTCSVM
ncbi:uncharacterized protein LOC127444213 [Myxocyprinus asiaticus]|uniref:uncharacterized protein LOC127444213 n=1 Tax=Myxocyprinus asiaticus TaxID=70543 RepID=UPI002222C1A1|nr:uncharacterized protein LOC127444213 [Myxocyprinus asiaticus]